MPKVNGAGPLPPCPVCGSEAFSLHMFSSYDRADFGWECGCPRYSLFDKVHPDKSVNLVCKGVEKVDAERAWVKLCKDLTQQDIASRSTNLSP